LISIPTSSSARERYSGQSKQLRRAVTLREEPHDPIGFAEQPLHRSGPVPRLRRAITHLAHQQRLTGAERRADVDPQVQRFKGAVALDDDRLRILPIKRVM